MNALYWFIDESFTAHLVRRNPLKSALLFVAVVALVVVLA